MMELSYLTFSACMMLLSVCPHVVTSKQTRPLKASLALQCPPCARLHCYPRRASQLKCPGGITRGPCNCCPKCAKVEGQKCGGVHNYLGKCDIGLYCHPNPTQKRPKYKRQPEGTCRKAPTFPGDQPFLPSYCKPKCTPEYCRTYPKAICAAADNADKKQPCQGDCQHTSCSTCRFVDEPDCQKCSRDNFKCMRQFAKCIKRKSYCTRQKFPCRRYSKAVNETGKFQCMVPECITF